MRYLIILPILIFVAGCTSSETQNQQTVTNNRTPSSVCKTKNCKSMDRLQTAVENAKKVFTTKQDHKDLDALYKKYKSKDFKFKFMQDGDGVALWNEGKKEFVFDHFDKSHVTINGKKRCIEKDAKGANKNGHKILEDGLLF